MEIAGNKEKKSIMEEVDGLICSMARALHKQMDMHAEEMDGRGSLRINSDFLCVVDSLAGLLKAGCAIRDGQYSQITIKPDVITSSCSTSEITMTKDGITISDKPKQAKLQSMETGEAGIIEILRQEMDMRTMKEHAAIALISEGKYDEATAILKSIDDKNITNEILGRLEIYCDKYGGRVPRKGEWKLDCAIESLTEYAEIEARDLKQEYDSGEYGSVQECPSFEKIKAYADAINILLEYYAPDWGRKTPESLAGIDSGIEGEG